MAVDSIQTEAIRVVEQPSSPGRVATKPPIDEANTHREEGWNASVGKASQFTADSFQVAGGSAAPPLRREVEQWLAPPIEGNSNAACDRDIAAGQALLQGAKLSPLEQARVQLRLSGLIMQKADSAETMFLDKRSLATDGFQALKRAYDLAPSDPLVVEAYARTIDNFARLGSVKQFFLSQGLGINIAASAAEVLGGLKKHPDNASIQFARLRLAEVLGDTDEMTGAREALKKLPAKSVEQASASYDATSARVAKAAKSEK
jgi:hypothetical protein